MRADQHAVAAKLTDGEEAVLVGEVVAEEDRLGALERGLGHEGADGVALARAGRSQLYDHVAGLQGQAGDRRQALGQIDRLLLAVGGQAVVQGQAERLVLDQQARVAVGEVAQRRASGGQARMRRRFADDAA